MKEFFKANYLLFMKIILTIYTLYSLKYLYKLKHIESEFYMNITFIFVIAAVYLLINYTLNTLKNGIDKRLLIISLLMGLYFAFTVILGAYYEGVSTDHKKQMLDFTYNSFIISLKYIPALWFMCSGIIMLIYMKLPHFLKPILESNIKMLDKFNSLYKIWFFIFICWLPYFILLYPGSISFDANHQLTLLFSGKYSFPLLSAFSHYFTYIIYEITNNGLLSIALYVLFIQMIPFAFALAYMLYNIKKIFKVNDLIYILLILFCALYPHNPLFSITILKDVLFYIFFILFLTNTIMIVYSPSILHNKVFMLVYIILALLLCLARNNVIYGLFFALPFIIILTKNYRKKVLFLFATVFTVYLLILIPVINMTNFSKIYNRESVSLPLQQLARVYKYHKDNLSDDDKKYIENVINIKSMKRYQANLSDPVKMGYNAKYFSNINGIINYIKIGLKYPGTYLNSILIMSQPLWDMFNKNPFSTTLGVSLRDVKALNVESAALKDKKNKFFLKYISSKDKIARESSFINFYLFNIGLFLNIFILSFMYFIYKKDYKNIIVLLIPLGYIITILMGPLIQLRFTYHFNCIIPILVMMLANRNNSEMVSNTREK